MTNLEIYRDHRKKLIRLRDRLLARYEAARNKKTVDDDLEQAEALNSAVELLDREIDLLKAMRSRLLDRDAVGNH